MKKMVIISCFDWYETRLKNVKKFFEHSGYEVQVYTSDYNHLTKLEKDKVKEIIYIPVYKYKKNMSVGRLVSHSGFAKKIGKILKQEKPDIIYSLIPPNTLGVVCARYRRKNECKLIFDIIDLWPESMPGIPGKMKTFLYIWGWLRNYGLKKADYVITECKYYQITLKKFLKNNETDVLYLKKYSNKKPEFHYDNKIINICYLGKINYLLDISLICDFLAKLSKKKRVIIHIIGTGDKEKIFISKIRENAPKVEIKFLGKIFDENRKHEIFSKCHLALNVMHVDVKVGLTMKSIDYLEAGLPLLNSIQGDTQLFVEKYGAGFNINKECIDQIVEEISTLSKEDWDNMHKAARKIFEKYLDEKVVNKKQEEILKRFL